MSDKLHLLVVTRTKQVVDTEVTEVRLPGTNGELGVLPGHTGLLTSLATGELAYRIDSTMSRLAVQDGFAEILDDKVTVLAEIADEPESIDLEAAKADRAEAEEALKTASAEELEELTKRLRLAEVRQRVAGQAGH